MASDTPPILPAEEPISPAAEPSIDPAAAQPMTPPEAPAAAVAPAQPVMPSAVNVINPEGKLVSIAPEQLDDAINSGYQPATSEHIAAYEQDLKYGSPGQTLKAVAEGVGEGVLGPVLPFIEKAAGIKPEDIRGREEAHPGTRMISQAVGLAGSMLTGVGEGALLAKAGAVVPKAFGLGGKTASLMSKIGAQTVSDATQMVLLQTGDEVSKMIKEDPHQSAETALTNIGLSGLIGAAGGTIFGAAGPAWKASVGDRAGQMIEDFKGRMNYHLKNPDPATAVTEELGQHYRAIREMADDVYGPQGLKAKDVEKAMPEMSERIVDQANSMAGEMRKTIDKMRAQPHMYPDRLVSKLEGDLERFESAALPKTMDPGAIEAGAFTPSAPRSASEVFNAMQELKQTVQGYSKFEKFVKPVDAEYDFVRGSKDLGYKLRNALEDSQVWGKAAERQKAINKAFVEFKPTLEDFEKKFTSEVNGERVIDPGKVTTYMNQLGKASAELKQEMLGNFLKASEKYRGVIADTHANLGIENPFQHSPLALARGTMEEITPGAKIADYFVKRGLANLAGEATGASIGAVVGHLFGHAGFGALIGEHALAPFFSSVLPAIVRPMMESARSVEGFRSAIDYGLAVAKGENMIGKAAKNVFRAGAEVLSETHRPSEAQRLRLDKMLQKIQLDPKPLLNVAGSSGHYMPAHSEAVGQFAANASNYLNGLRPTSDPRNPLDSKMPASQFQKASYNRALDIAEQPLLVLDSIKKGNLTPQDIMTMKAIYPKLYDKLSNHLIEGVMTTVDKGESIPYKTRLSLAMFLGQPLDSTMTPEAIQAMQSSRGPASQPPQQPAAPVKHSTAALGKLSGIYRTTGQKAEANRISKQ
jgi:hypothetical protein